MFPETSVTQLKGLTKTHKDILQQMKIETVQDLIFYFPSRHEDFSALVALIDAPQHDQVTIVATVKRIKNRRSFRRRMILSEALVEDETGSFIITWFQQPYVATVLQTGQQYRFAGKVSKTKFGLRLINPLFERVEMESSAKTAPFLPVYSVTAGISQYMMRKIMRIAEPVIDQITDQLPDVTREKYGLMSMKLALRAVHFPTTEQELIAAKRRLAFDEMLKVQLAVGSTKKWRISQRAPTIALQEQAMKKFVVGLPFALTQDQRVAAWETVNDMTRAQPMYRLLDGDVGSGKTVVAAIAMVNAAASEYQCSLMAPTEILARQHYQTLKKFFTNTDLRVALWTNAYKQFCSGEQEIICLKKNESDLLRQEIANGAVDIVIGTHALLEDTIQFRALGLAVIDEQHRFGVRARQILATKSGMPGLLPHLLSMTATPIPRSLALTVFGDLDLSLLKEKPAQRLPIITTMVHPKEQQTAYRHIRKEVALGRQAFVICPLIEESDTIEVASVMELAERLRKDIFFDIRLEVLHGKLPADEKERIMKEFSENKIAALVATSVVEVGIDVPNATVMCIEGAERFGLAQLHQFRGRVGRGSHQSYCYVLPTILSPHVKERMNAIVSLNDGFALAEKDLSLRGPGDMFGVAQTGFPELRFATLTDTQLIHDAREVATEILARDESLAKDFVARDMSRAHLE